MNLITRKEIADKYNVHPLTVANWHKAEKIAPVKKIGTAFLYDDDDVAAFVQSNKAKQEVHNEVYSRDGEYENGYGLTYRGWLKFSKRKKLDDVPPREIVYQFFRKAEDD